MNRHKLPNNGLARAALVEVPSLAADGVGAHPVLKVKVWLGLLASELERLWAAHPLVDFQAGADAVQL